MTDREMPPEMAAYAKRNPAQCAMIEAICKGMAPVIREFVEKGVEKLCQPLHDRIKALEARPTLRYAGTWNPDTQFNQDDVATDHGSAWHCERSTRSRPPSKDWALMVKRGRDSR